MTTATLVDQLIDPGEHFDRSYIDMVQQAELAPDSHIDFCGKALATLDQPDTRQSIFAAIPHLYLPHIAVVPHPARVL